MGTSSSGLCVKPHQLVRLPDLPQSFRTFPQAMENDEGHLTCTLSVAGQPLGLLL